MLRSPALLLLCVLGRAAAEESDPEPKVAVLSLPEALAYAEAHQPLIRGALAELAARQSEARVPRSLWLPHIGGTVQLIGGTANNTTASYLGVREADLPRIGGTRTTSDASWEPSPSTLAALSLSQELYDFGRIAAQAAVADALTQIARANAASIGLDVRLAVEEAFHGVLGAREVLRATEDAHKRALAHRDLAQAGARSGMRPPIEVTRAQADVAQLEVRRIRAETGLKAARAALAAAIGSDALEVDAQANSSEESPAPAFDEALTLADRRNPLVAAALAKIRVQKEVQRAIAHELVPNLFASATLSGRAGGATPTTGAVPYGGGWLPDVGNWHLGAVLQWNVFDATVLARRAAAAARERATEAELEVVRTAVRLSTQQAFLQLRAAQRTLPGLGEAAQAAQANQAQAEARFRAGLGTTVELADAEALLTNAQLEQAMGRFAMARARAALGRAIAEDLAPPSQSGGRPK